MAEQSNDSEALVLGQKGKELLQQGLAAATEDQHKDFGPFHRVESTTQSVEVAALQQSSGEAWGKARRGPWGNEQFV
jgi:hypothetical protein